jgi:hypothetical protein
MVGTMEDGKARDAEVFLRHREGYRVPVRAKSAAVRNDTGLIVGAVEIFSGNSLAVNALALAGVNYRAAMIDALTGIPNRRSAARCSRSSIWTNSKRSMTATDVWPAIVCCGRWPRRWAGTSVRWISSAAWGRGRVPRHFVECRAGTGSRHS